MRHPVSALISTLIFTVFVPGTVAGYIPWQLRRNTAVAVQGLELWLAATLVALGVTIYLYTAFWGFAWIGRGTPAPIAPTKTLVARGLHHYVRNPMYIGVALVIGGQAWLFHSLHIAVYLAGFWLVAHFFVLFYEEPTLRQQFGEEYEGYCASVPRWIPKVR